jgi:hypothetical protein
MAYVSNGWIFTSTSLYAFTVWYNGRDEKVRSMAIRNKGKGMEVVEG